MNIKFLKIDFLASILTYAVGAQSFQSCPTLIPQGLVACQAPLSMGFFRQEY